MSAPVTHKPAYVAALEAAYGAPSRAGFGSAVFFDESENGLEQAALEKYKCFVGANWQVFGETMWLRRWKRVYARMGGKRDIVAELRGITDTDAKHSVPMILDNLENADRAREALSAAFDDAAVAQLAVYNIGDGEAMSGILIAGQRAQDETTFLVFLLD